MILDMAWDKEKCYLFTGGVDMKCRSWMAEIGSEAKVFEGATRSVSCLLVRGNICKCSWCKETDSSFPFLIFSLFIIFKDLFIKTSFYEIGDLFSTFVYNETKENQQ